MAAREAGGPGPLLGLSGGLQGRALEARPTPPRPRGSPVARSLGPCQPLRTNTRVRQQETSHVIVPQVLQARHPAPLSQ